MPIAKITGQGLAAISFAVALLWGCIIGEHFQQENAFRERARVMRDLRMQRPGPRRVPVSDPSPLVPHRLHVTAG